MQKKAPEFKPRMEVDPEIDIKPDARPEMPMITPQKMQEPKQLEAQAEDADIFIG